MSRDFNFYKIEIALPNSSLPLETHPLWSLARGRKAIMQTLLQIIPISRKLEIRHTRCSGDLLGSNAEKDLTFFSLHLIFKSHTALKQPPAQGALLSTKFPSLRRELGEMGMRQLLRAITPCPHTCGKAARRGR